LRLVVPRPWEPPADAASARPPGGALGRDLDLERAERDGSRRGHRRGVLPGGDAGAERRRHAPRHARRGRRRVDGDGAVLRRPARDAARARNAPHRRPGLNRAVPGTRLPPGIRPARTRGYAVPNRSRLPGPLIATFAAFAASSAV